jgi:hypothetical protein
LEKFKRDRGEPETRDELEAERRAKRGEMRDRRRKDRKEERRKSKAEPTAKPAKVGYPLPRMIGSLLTHPDPAYRSSTTYTGRFSQLSIYGSPFYFPR